MNILYDYQIFSAQKYGGISRYFYEVSNRIAELKGNEVEIISPLYVNKYFNKKCKVIPLGVEIPDFPHTKKILNILNSSLSNFFVNRKNGIDIFHETYYSRLNNLPKNAKRVITIHDMIHEKYSNKTSSPDKEALNKALAVKRADHIICVSENTRLDLIDILNVPVDKTSVVYHGYEFIVQDNIQCQSSYNNKPFILYVGKRSGYKNFNEFVLAYSKSAYLRKEFSIICFGGGEFNTYEKTLFNSLNISFDKVFHLSGTDNVLANLYRTAAVFIYPSLYEGFGMPTLEAMSFGCPVACSNTSSLPEVVGNAAELFNPLDIDEISNALLSVLSSTERARELTLLGKENINRFSWGKCARDTLSVYDRLLLN